MKHLILPDAHVKHGHNLDRFVWLSKLIIKEQPDKIICLGDFADMESLCSYDKGKRSFENRRYTSDLEAVHLAQGILFTHLKMYNMNQRRKKAKQYTPKLYMCLGNHEDRINTAVNNDPVLEGVISIDDLKYQHFGWKVIPYQDILELDGVYYSHLFVSGVMGRPISGEHPAYSLIAKKHLSCTVGHSHTFDYTKSHRADGKPINGLVAGCFLEHREDYARQANNLWVKGLFIKHNVKDGNYDLEFISLERLEKEYG